MQGRCTAREGRDSAFSVRVLRGSLERLCGSESLIRDDTRCCRWGLTLSSALSHAARAHTTAILISELVTHPAHRSLPLSDSPLLPRLLVVIPMTPHLSLRVSAAYRGSSSEELLDLRQKGRS